MPAKKHITVYGWAVIVIMVFAAILRFWNYGSIPFMHDEFSALFRTWYHSVSDLIEIGVKQNDSHPAGVQLFIYFWIKLFGISEPGLKFTFTLLGLGSVFMSWLIARTWYNKNTALFTAAFMAITQYNIFYSQLARPYAPGLFFSLVAVWFWSKVVFNENLKKQDWLFFVLFVAINSYIHAFTLFFNLLMAVTGLLFVRGRRLKNYLWAGLAVLLLYLPGVPVFMAQLGRGDIGGWLCKPNPGFLSGYFNYIFHFSSWFFVTTVAVTAFLSIKYFNSSKSLNKFRIIGLTWFVVTFAVAYGYSVLRSPIIQYSTLLFVFPFLLMAFFSFFDKLPIGTALLSVAMITFTGLFTLIFVRLHYVEMYKQGFDRIPLNVISDLKQYHHHQVAVVLQAPDDKMFDYYFNKYNRKPDYLKLEKKNNFPEIKESLKQQNADIVLFGMADYAPFQYLEALKEKYPYVVKHKAWFNSEYWVLTKNRLLSRTKNREDIIAVSSPVSFRISENSKYGQSIEISLDTMALQQNSVLFVKAIIKSSKVTPDARLVIDWRDSADNAVFWSASPFKDFTSPDTSFVVTSTVRIRDIQAHPDTGTVKFYIWKKDKSVINVEKIKVGITSIFPVEMGLYEPI